MYFAQIILFSFVLFALALKPNLQFLGKESLFHRKIEKYVNNLRLTVCIFIDSIPDLRVTKRVTDVQIADDSSLTELQQHCWELDIVWPCCKACLQVHSSH